MKAATFACVVASLIMGTHLVAAGVVQVLGGFVIEINPAARDTSWPWALVGFVAVAASLLFLRGAIELARDLAFRRKQRRRATP